jgi:transcriptional regulator with XRE-family HTH domain
MTGGDMIRESRRRAGLTQRQLAGRVGTTQSALARVESGRTEPSFERVVEIVRACGLEFVPQLVAADDADWSVASHNLTLDVDARVRNHRAALRFIAAGRGAMADARR